MDHSRKLVVSVKQGEDFSAKIEWFDDNGEYMLLATEATKQNALMQIRNMQGDLVLELKADEIYSQTNDDGETYYNNTHQGYIYVYPEGEIHLFIPWHVSDKVPVGKYVFDLFADVDLPEENQFKPSGDTQRRSVMAGQVIVRPRITQPFLD